MPRSLALPPLPLLTLASLWPLLHAFNLDTDKVTEYSGPPGSYFGYSVDFYIPDSKTTSVLIGAPKANTSQPDTVEGGAVYNCPFPSTGNTGCRRIPFDTTSSRYARLNGTKHVIEFKSRQWFGAAVRSHKEKVVACAPLYHWRSVKETSERDPVGTCYVAVQNFNSYAEYSPCRNHNADPAGQGYCQAGFSLDFYKNGDIAIGGPGSFYWQGQVFSASIVEIIKGYSFKSIIRELAGERKTVADSAYDDSYLGYSVAVGEFTGDPEQEIVAGVPRGEQNFGYVSILHSIYMVSIHNFTGDQMASYFGYTVAVSDVNSDGLDDVLIGAPLLMDREFESNPKEVGQVYLYLQQSHLFFKDAQVLKGIEVFGRFGSSIAGLGDLNQDGFNDVAIGSPFGGEDRRGRVYIYNGNSNGLNKEPSQILEGLWASNSLPAGFGFTLRGDSDIDKNDYPDLIIGAFGVGKVAVYRARPVVSVDAQLLLHPMILNPENKSCVISLSDTHSTAVTCFTVTVCVQVSGQGIPHNIVLKADLELDWLKQKGAVKRTLFLDYFTAHHALILTVGKDKPTQCQNFVVYLREETEFRDKLTPITVNLNYSLDESAFLNDQELKPILNRFKEAQLQEQAHILVDCGEDNMCIPELKLSAQSDKRELIIGEENHILLIINARNDGEGAYEAELHVNIPPEAEYKGIERHMEGLRQLSCEYKMENESRIVVCDLGNPMVAGTNLSLGLRLVVRNLENSDYIKFDLQVKSSNKDNPNSNLVALEILISAVAQVEIRGVSHPPQIILPIPNWKPKQKPTEEAEIGPLVQHIYELHNIGPSTVGETHLSVGWPYMSREEFLLYIFQIATEGPITCHPSSAINTLKIQTSELEDTPELASYLRNSSVSHAVSRRDVPLAEPLRHVPVPTKLLNCTNIKCLTISCSVRRLGGGERAVIKIRSRLWAETFLQRKNDYYSLTANASFEVKKMPYTVHQAKLPAASIAIKTSVIWATPNVSFSIPLWVIILAILLGLLVLAILTLVMWKCGFFDRARPPQEDVTDDTEKLTNKASEA